jgi:imidazolonepropionase-like amidohydrolase
MNQRTIFTSATVYDGRNPRQSNMTVVVEDGRIVSIEKGAIPPAGGQRIDLGGKAILPGMTVGHWHGEFAGIGPPTFSHGRGGTFLGTEQPPAILALQAATAMRAALMSGVMRVVSAACSNNLDAQMKLAVDSGLIDGPHVIACSRHIVTTGDYEDRGQWWKPGVVAQDGIRRVGTNVFADGVTNIARAVREEILFGAEIIKILPNGGHGFEWTPTYRGLSSAELRCVVETAHERDKRVRAHVTTKESILECIEVGVDIIDHGDFLDEECIEAMVRHGTFYIPSILFTKLFTGAGQGLKPELSKPGDRAWVNLLEMLPKANAAGVKMVPGDDYGGQGMGHALGVYARELQVYVDDFGIPAQDVIRWCTANGAELAALDDQTGTIEPGKAADLIVVDGDPALNIGLLTDPGRYLKAIVQKGRFVKDELGASTPVARDRASGAVRL